ncbi:MAG: pseudouridine synthase [bacterium]|nr:pseudouridine synthase [bacterium]
MERLQKRIANLGYTSRRKAEELITSARVRVNDDVITELGFKVKSSDKIYVDDVLLVNSGKVYYLLNKPRGVICTTSDDKNRKTVTSLIDTDTRIFPIGRLDYDTTGAIILTNDGELSNILTNSSNEVKKRYIAKVKGIIMPYQIKRMKDGLTVDGIRYKKCQVKVKRYDKKTDTSIVEVIITEGRNHQVKKMFESIGSHVLKLKRENFAFLDVSSLKSGDYRVLTPKEVKQLYSLEIKKKTEK